ncbi:2-dehydropantoate 2-reductase [Verrucomicrobiales bacterium]|nr:2-dehydropantoate 2-reductase [Verrucomicrobiales bacterium]
MYQGLNNLNPRIAIVGSGAVGSYYGGKLAISGANVHFLMRADLEHVRRFGLRIESNKTGVEHLEKVNTYGCTADIGYCDLVIIALKATDNHSLEKILPPLLKEDTVIMTLQNGLGNEEFLANRFGGNRVIGGLCFVCINRPSPGTVHHIAQGSITCGEFSGLPIPRTHDIGLIFKRADIPFLVAESLPKERWRKLVWNIPFNGLAIVGGAIDTATVLATKNLYCLAKELMKEIMGVALALGYELPDSLIEHNINETKKMGSYTPSSMIDFIMDKPVEVEAIWGEAVRAGLKVDSEIVRMECLYNLIRIAIERRDNS